VLVSTQLEPHIVRGAVQLLVDWHTPETQLCDPLHAFAHDPQCETSFCVSTHEPLHEVSPLAHAPESRGPASGTEPVSRVPLSIGGGGASRTDVSPDARPSLRPLPASKKPSPVIAQPVVAIVNASAQASAVRIALLAVDVTMGAPRLDDRAAAAISWPSISHADPTKQQLPSPSLR
jgi:hypothetical protein